VPDGQEGNQSKGYRGCAGGQDRPAGGGSAKLSGGKNGKRSAIGHVFMSRSMSREVAGSHCNPSNCMLHVASGCNVQNMGFRTNNLAEMSRAAASQHLAHSTPRRAPYLRSRRIASPASGGSPPTGRPSRALPANHDPRRRFAPCYLHGSGIACPIASIACGAFLGSIPFQQEVRIDLLLRQRGACCSSPASIKD
jgi:hypothetical protein